MKIIKYDELDSTNEEAKRIFRQGGERESGFIVIAGRQSAGRGQQGRSFFSPPGSGLYMSVCLTQNTAPGGSLVTQAAALAVCRCVRRLYGTELGIKPVNDLIYRGRKVGGILVESDGAYGAAEHRLIIGIGLNLYMPPGGFPCELDGIAGYIFEEKINKDALVFSLGEELAFMSRDFSSLEILDGYLARVVKKEFLYDQ